jgi:hypothetical protein
MRFRQLDAIALAAVPLVVAAFWAGGAILPTICLCLAGAIVVHVIAGHGELAWGPRLAASTLVFAVAVGMVVYLYRVNLAKELKPQVAPLVAAALPSPVSSNCPIPKGAVALYLGNAVSVVTEFPHTVFRVHGEDVFVLDRDASGLLVTFAAFDDGGKVVGRLNRNVFTAINPTSHVERPSASNLIVLDDRETKVLDVQFLNPQAIKITGTLRYPGVDPIVITEKYLGMGGSIVRPACRSGAEVDLLFN